MHKVLKAAAGITIAAIMVLLPLAAVFKLPGSAADSGSASAGSITSDNSAAVSVASVSASSMQASSQEPQSAASSSIVTAAVSKPAVSSKAAVSSTKQTTMSSVVAPADKSVFGEYTKQHVAKLKEAVGNGENKLVFTLLTDTHEYNEMLKTTAANIAAVNRQVPSVALVHLGDIIDGNKTKSMSLAILGKSVSLLQGTGLPFLTVRGNHDDNSYQNDKSFNSIISSEEWYQATQKAADASLPLVRQEHNSSFYYDVPTAKVRMVTLSCDIGNPGTTLDELPSINGKTYWGFDFSSLYWLGTTALQNLPEGWQVLILSHSPTRRALNPFDKEPLNGKQIEGILQAFTQGGTYTAADLIGGAATQVEFTFEKQGKRDIIAFFYGHIHADLIARPAELSYPYIATANAFGIEQVDKTILPLYASVPSPRKRGSISENCWESVVVDTSARTIQMIRYGAGHDRTIRY